MKPLIGVTPDFTQGGPTDPRGTEPSYVLRARYIRAIEDLGGVPVILPLTSRSRMQRRLLDGVQGLLVTGSGPDLPPKLYGERQRYPFPVLSPRRYEFELEMIRLAAASGTPVLGICGGMQAVNVALGGSLIQDIPSQIGAALAHRQAEPATRLSHLVHVSPRTLLYRITRRSTVRVNSSHHQSVQTVPASMLVSGVAPDGVIEAIEAPRHPFLLGVQWHPEFLYDRYAMHRRVFLAFVHAARKAA